jgi:class 3 adenylate cyclase/tetratricopeptide (TPR) repeat protein
VDCPSCGRANDAGNKFCGECGSPLVLVCPACGTRNGPDNRFCGECGTSLAVGVGPAERPTGDDLPAAERRLVSVLFADLVGFTTLSEARDSEDVRELLTRYFDTSRRIVDRYGGTVEKFIGDAVMAVWGTPVANEDDAERAVRAALELTDAVRALGEEIAAPTLRARAGVLTGEAAVTIGAKDQGMVAGDLVNTASRVQSAAPPGGVLVGEATKHATEAAIDYEDAGLHELKGKAEPVQLWRAARIVAGARGDLRVAGLEPPFVGRDRQLRTIKETFHATADEGRARLLSVIGPPGIGKSRLVWEFFKYIDGLADDARWHVGRCLSYGEGITFWALAEMVRTNAGIREGEDPAAALPKLREAITLVVAVKEERRWVEPRLASLLGIETGPAREREDLFAAWRFFYERLAAEMPTIMVFEDLQWADDALLDFIDYLMEWSRDHRLFILTMARPELLDRRPDWGSGRRSASIHLEPLPPEAMGALMSGLAPGLPDELSGRVLARAEGVPLYAVETIRMLLDRGQITQEDGGFRPTAPVEELEVPESLHGLIAARLDGLEPAQRRLIQDASVLGKTFTRDAIIAVNGSPPQEADAILATLLRKELLGVQADRLSPEHGQYEFLGDLVRWVAYETLSKKERRVRHLAVARWQEQLGEDDAIELIASHYLRAYDADPAAEDADEIRLVAFTALTRAGERAAALGANGEARRQFLQAAELTTSDQDRADLLDRTGAIALRELRYDDARAFFAEAISLYERIGATHAAARASARLAEADYVENRLDEAITRLESAFEVLSDEQEDRDLAVLAAQLGRMRYFAGDIHRADEAIEIALRISEAEGYPDVISEAMNTRSIIVSSLGRYQEGIALLRHALSLALEHDLPEPALRAYNNLAETATDLDRHEEGLEIYERGLALADRVGSDVWKRSLLSEIVFPLMMTGRWDEALERAAQVPDSQKSGSDIIGLLVSIPVIDVARGDLAGAERILEIFEGYGRSSDVQQVAAYACANASVLRAHGKYAEALDSARRAVTVAEQVGYTGTIKVGFTQGIGAAFSLGDLDAVRGFINAIDDIRPGIELPFLRALADRTRARLAVIEGDEEPSHRNFKAAIGLFREIGIPYWRALSQIEFAEALVAAGRADEVSSLAQEARDTLDRLGASTWLERLDKLQLTSVPAG